jgi:hypothetical protein
MNNDFILSGWQKKQAVLLYYFSSMDYLLGLKQRVSALRETADILIGDNLREGRDQIIKKSRWGHRDTGENWANNGWPFLADFQFAVTRDIADRDTEIYHVTNACQCARGMAEYSTHWMNLEEQRRFEKMFEEVSAYAGNIDDTMDKTNRASRWDDFGLTMAWQEQKEHFPILPKLIVVTDVVEETGRLPLRTGVYVAADDPDAALQFAWTGSPTGKLLECTSFNTLGKAALEKIGRSRLWLDEQKMLDFVIENQNDPRLRSDSFFTDSFKPHLASSLVARNAFTSHATRWYYVDIVRDEFEAIEAEPEKSAEDIHRFEAGSVCQKAGMYFTPAQVGSRRRFKIGDVFTALDSQYGRTIWQWDTHQD